MSKNDITNKIITLIVTNQIIDKKSNGNSSFFVNTNPSIDNNNGDYSEPNISSIPLYDFDFLTKTTQFDTSDNPNNSMNSTMDLIENAYNEMKTKSCRDALILNIKDDIEKIVRNEMKAQFLLQEEHQNSVIEKVTIENLENEICYLKKELEMKNKIIETVFSRTSGNGSPNDFDEDSIFFENSVISKEPVDMEKANKNNSIQDNNLRKCMCDIDDQLTSIRKHKHKMFLELQQNKTNNTNHDIVDFKIATSINNTQDEMIISSTYYDDIPNNEKWKPNTTLIVGDSMIAGIDEKRISGSDDEKNHKKRNVKVRMFEGAKIVDMYDYIKPLLKKCPANLIVHVATNDTVSKTSSDILNEIILLKQFFSSKAPGMKVIFSNLVKRFDNPDAALVAEEVNEHLNELGIDIIDNSNIDGKCLGRKGLHLNAKGAGKLALNFIKKINRLNKN